MCILIFFFRSDLSSLALDPRTFRRFQYFVCHHFPAPEGQKWTFFGAREGTWSIVAQQSTGARAGPNDFGALESSGRGVAGWN